MPSPLEWINRWVAGARVSPTALYTAYVWQRHGRSVPELESLQSRLMHLALEPSMFVSRSLGLPTLEDFLLARHDLIDDRLTQAIEAGKVRHVIEIAAGLSPRGSRFIDKYGKHITYTEADLPGMVAQKRRLLENRLARNPHHKVEVIDAFATQGEASLASVAGRYAPDGGIAIITEGLLNYFDQAAVNLLLGQIKRLFEARESGLYLADIHFSGSHTDPLSRAFASMLGAFVQGRIHLHFENDTAFIHNAELLGLEAEVLNPKMFADQFESCRAPGAGLTNVIVVQ